MANTDQPNGFRPYQVGNASPKVGKYLAGTTTSIFRGDVVAIAANGRLHRIATTTGSAQVIGVALNYVNATSAPGSTTAQNVWVYDDPDQLFVVQDDGAAATPAYSAVGASYALIIGAGNTTTGQSIFEVDASASGTVSTDAVIIRGFLEGGAYEIGKNSKMIVALSRHKYKTNVVGI